MSRAANAPKALRSRTCGRLYSCDTLLKWLPQHVQDVAAEVWSCIQQEHPMVRQRDFARPWHLAAPDQPHIGDGVVGARNGRVVTKAVRSPVRPATRWMRVVSRASGRVISGRMVVSRRASIDFPAPGASNMRRLGL
jgi:hypothetical protein